jgi:CRISPR-associated protein Cas2
MRILVVYDIATETNNDQRRLRRVAKICEGYGIRIQKSVFECHIDATTSRRLAHDLKEAIDPHRDSVGMYRLHERQTEILKHLGKVNDFKHEEPFIL